MATRPRNIGPLPCATSTPGTGRSACSRGRSSICRRPAGYESGDKESQMLSEWTEPPPMSAVAPMPVVLSSDGTLWLAYRIGRDPDHCAVLRFHHVVRYAWGAPPAAHVVDVTPELPRGSFYEVAAAP